MCTLYLFYVLCAKWVDGCYYSRSYLPYYCAEKFYVCHYFSMIYYLKLNLHLIIMTESSLSVFCHRNLLNSAIVKALVKLRHCAKLLFCRFSTCHSALNNQVENHFNYHFNYRLWLNNQVGHLLYHQELTNEVVFSFLDLPSYLLFF